MPRKPNYDRDDLIARARDLFWQRGWAGTSMKDLEAELGLKPGSFYAAFGSKDALFALALDTYAQDSQKRLTNLAERYGPLGALKALPRAIVETRDAPARACMLSKTLLELQAHEHPHAHTASRHLDQMETRFADLFEQAQKTGDIRSDHTAAKLARRYQSDLLGLRVTAERRYDDAIALAQEIAADLERL